MRLRNPHEWRPSSTTPTTQRRPSVGTCAEDVYTGYPADESGRLRLDASSPPHSLRRTRVIKSRSTPTLTVEHARRAATVPTAVARPPLPDWPDTPATDDDLYLIRGAWETFRDEDARTRVRHASEGWVSHDRALGLQTAAELAWSNTVWWPQVGAWIGAHVPDGLDSVLRAARYQTEPYTEVETIPWVRICGLAFREYTEPVADDFLLTDEVFGREMAWRPSRKIALVDEQGRVRHLGHPRRLESILVKAAGVTDWWVFEDRYRADAWTQGWSLDRR